MATLLISLGFSSEKMRYEKTEEDNVLTLGDGWDVCSN